MVNVDTNTQVYGDSGELFLNDNSLYTAAVPYFTGNTWSNMLSMDPSVAQSFTWNDFITNITSESAFIFFRAIDTNNYNAPAIYIGNLLSPTNTGVTAPPNTLQNGMNYRVELLFSDRYTSAGGGFESAAGATVGFDVLTYDIPEHHCADADDFQHGHADGDKHGPRARATIDSNTRATLGRKSGLGIRPGHSVSYQAGRIDVSERTAERWERQKKRMLVIERLRQVTEVDSGGKTRLPEWQLFLRRRCSVGFFVMRQ